jgi:hypothetical protein
MKTKILQRKSVIILALLGTLDWSYNNQKFIVNTETKSNSYLQTKSLISKLEFNSIFFIDP